MKLIYLIPVSFFLFDTLCYIRFQSIFYLFAMGFIAGMFVAQVINDVVNRERFL